MADAVASAGNLHAGTPPDEIVIDLARSRRTDRIGYFIAVIWFRWGSLHARLSLT
jgi:hypothetical protein